MAQDATWFCGAAPKPPGLSCPVLKLNSNCKMIVMMRVTISVMAIISLTVMMAQSGVTGADGVIRMVMVIIMPMVTMMIATALR